MAVMGVVQVPVYQIVKMVAMGHHRVTAVRPVHMIRIMTAALMARSASCRVLFTHLQPMLVHMIAMHVVQVTIMKIIHVVAMLNGLMATVFTMLMIVIQMNLTLSHC